MLNEFLKVAYSQNITREFVDELKKLPVDDLYKLAGGMKFAHLDGCGDEWLDKFKGTPLFEQAIQLAQEEIQLDMAREQESAMNQQTWQAQAQMGLKKRLLSLQLAQLQAKTQGAPPQEMPAASPPPAQVEVTTPAPQAPPETPGVGPKVAMEAADKWGRALARMDLEKQALAMPSLSSLGQAAKGVGQAVKGMGLVNKGALIGGAVGGLGGLASGLQKDEHGQRHIMSGLARGALGAAGGAALGGVGQHAYKNISSGMAGGQSLGQAAKGWAGNLGSGLKSVGQNAVDQVGRASSGAPTKPMGPVSGSPKPAPGNVSATPSVAPSPAATPSAAAPTPAAASVTPKTPTPAPTSPTANPPSAQAPAASSGITLERYHEMNAMTPKDRMAAWSGMSPAQRQSFKQHSTNLYEEANKQQLLKRRKPTTSAPTPAAGPAAPMTRAQAMAARVDQQMTGSAG